jgi:hypothetical protein
MSDSSFSAQRNPWITRGGAAVFLALAIGLLVSAGGPMRALGYGPSTRPTTCGGYHMICAAQVGSVSTAPRVPIAGRGFTVSFKTTSGGVYGITVQRRGAAKPTTLSSGAAGVGSMSIKKLGKRLKAGNYSLVVTISSSSNSTTDEAKRALKIKKR